MSDTPPKVLKGATIKTASGREISLVCPICKNDEFVTIGPADGELRKGFRHVIMGVSAEDKTLYQTVRFFSCSDCGHIMKFLLPKMD